MEHEHRDIKARVLSRIKNGEVAMHTRAYLALKLAALGLLCFLALAVSVLIFTFILFTVRLNIQDALAHTGPYGWLFFIRFFPWHLLALDVVLIFLCETLLRSFKLGWRSPVLYLAFMLLALALALGLFLDRGVGFNDSMVERAHHHGLPPPFNEMYEHAHRDDLFPPVPSASTTRFIILMR